LPAACEAIADNEFTGLLVQPLDGSPLESLGQLSAAALERVKVRKIFEVRNPPGELENVRVLARWNNQAAAPAVLEKMFDQGHVLLWTTAADRSWSDWPTDASYVLAVREAARAVARSTASRRQTTAGQPLSLELPATHDITLPSVEVPNEAEPKPLVLGDAPRRPAADAASPAARTLTYVDTRESGLYKMSWRDSVSGPMQETFGVNPDRRESDLARIDRQQFLELWGAIQPEVISIGAGGDSSLAVRGQEVWRALATSLLGLLIVETCFARWAGRQR
jgi:hypothetical protein